MTDHIEYETGVFHEPLSSPCERANNRIAELGAINGELRAAAKNPSHIELQDLKWALKQAEAERDALRDMRCGESCANEAPDKNHAMCVGIVQLCNRWRPRDGGGG